MTIAATRIQIRDALFALVQTIPQSIGGNPYAYYGKRFFMPRMFPALSPVLLLRKMGEKNKRQDILRVTTLEYWLYGYFQQANPDQSVPAETPDALSAGEDLVAPMLDAVDAAFAIDDSGDGMLTLGGRVQSCWIDGDVPLEVGDAEAEGRGFFVVPILLDWPRGLA